MLLKCYLFKAFSPLFMWYYNFQMYKLISINYCYLHLYKNRVPKTKKDSKPSGKTLINKYLTLLLKG